VNRYTRAVNRLVQQKLLLPVDARKLRNRAFRDGP
jgi:hypothetical protein